MSTGTALFIPYDRRLTALARAQRRCPTPAEQKMWRDVLKLRQFSNYKFLRQKPLNRFIVDFYCAELKLVIEIDGHSHGEQQAYDAERTRILREHGLRVIRYTNDEVLHHIEVVYTDLQNRVFSAVD